MHVPPEKHTESKRDVQSIVLKEWWCFTVRNANAPSAATILT